MMILVGLPLGLLINFLIIDTFCIESFSSKVLCTTICAVVSALLTASRIEEEDS